MRVLDRYIVLAMGRYIVLSMAVLIVLLAVFLFVNEQGWVGAGRYGQLQALRYVLLQLPATALQLLPIAALVGALLAMGQLARGSELTVMRASGVSMARIAGSVAMAGTLLLPLALVVGEWFAPALAHLARVTRTLERNEALSLSQGGAWLREDHLLLRADPRGAITVFELDAAGRLDAVITAQRAQALAEGGWELSGLAGVRFDAAAVRPAADEAWRLAIPGGAALFDIARQDPRQQSLSALLRDIRQLEERGQDARAQYFSFWAGLARLAALPLAMLLAVPLVPGFLRRAEGGARVTLGLALGMLYFMAQRMVESGALAFSLDPLLLAWLPTLLLGSAVTLLLWRMRRVSTA